MADAYAERNNDGTLRVERQLGVSSDQLHRSSWNRSRSAEARRKIAPYEKISPIFGRTFAWGGRRVPRLARREG